MSPTHEHQLDQTVEALADNVEKAMDSLYKFQGSLLGGNNAENDRIREVFMSLRQELKKQWEDLRAYLHRCHAFAADVFMLSKVLGDTKVLERKEVLNDMVESAEELQNLSKVLEAFLSASGPHTSTSDNGRIPWPQLKKTVVDANFATASAEDAKKAFKAVDAAFAGIGINADKISKFWDFTTDKCRSYEKTPSSMTDKEANMVAGHWTVYKQALEKAIVSITRTTDVILVDPVAINRGRRKWFHSLIAFFWPSEN